MKDLMKVSFSRSMLTAFAAVSLVASAAAHADVDLAKSKVSAVSKQMNVPTEGAFKKFSAQVKFDPAKAAQGSAQMTIDVASYDLGDKMYNDQVAGKDWFDAKTYPQATFVSSAIAPAGGNKYNVTGKLTIKGKAETTSPFSYAAKLTEVMLLGVVALNAGKKIHYDGANMKITNAPQAEQFLKREYRQGWALS